MIRFTDARIPMGRDRRLRVPSWILCPGELWVISGGGGSGKSTLARAVAGLAADGGPDGLDDSSGSPARGIDGVERRPPSDGRGTYISFDIETAIRDRLRRDDDSEWSGRPDEGISIDRFLETEQARNFLAADLRGKLAGRGIRHLSTGEFRQVLIARQAGRGTAVAVLDEPFEGLDVDARPRLLGQLRAWRDSGTLVVLTVNRTEDIPPDADGLVILSDDTARVVRHGSTESGSTRSAGDWSAGPGVPPPPGDRDEVPEILVEMRDLSLSYNGRRVLEGVNWTVRRGESWLLTGPNGSGKTTLMNLICGDEPRGYGQHLWIFGRRRGSGESTADLRSGMGLVSTDQQERIPRHADLSEVIGSGLRDSPVLREPLDGWEMTLVRQWLALLNLERSAHIPCRRLPWSERRLALIARAMISHPPLLLLDEPMSGLDDAARDRVKALADAVIRDTNTAVILVSHRPDDAPDSIRRHLRLVPDPHDGPSRAVENPGP